MGDGFLLTCLVVIHFGAGVSESICFVLGFQFLWAKSTGSGVPLSTVDAL